MNRRASIALGFLALILAGAVVLCSPWARTGSGGVWGDVLTSAFTAFSSVCVTGLSVVDIGTHYTFAGQIAIIILVQIGCVGLMTCGTFLLIAIGRRLSLSREFSLMNAYGVAEVRGLRGLICWIVGSMLIIEAVYAFILYFPLGDAYSAVFYSVMSFCNAGFSLEPDSIALFADSPLVILSMATETILGTIGFLVIYNLCTYRFLHRTSGARGRLSLHTKVILRFTMYLLAASFAVFLLCEWNGTLAGAPFFKKLWVGFYQAVTPRTCGFCITPTEDLNPFTRLSYVIFMFIGGAPGSAAAGMKITTFAVLIYTWVAMCRGENETVIYRKSVPPDTVRESMVIFMALVVFTFAVVGALLLSEASSVKSGATHFESLFFEAVSAITTTGLSVGSTTRDLSPAGKIIIMCAMFVGRLGALTVVMMIGNREGAGRLRYPSEELVVG